MYFYMFEGLVFKTLHEKENLWSFCIRFIEFDIFVEGEETSGGTGHPTCVRKKNLVAADCSSSFVL